MKRIPKMVGVMTPFPHSIDLHSTLSHAQATMAKHEIGHLPVTENDRLVGILSERNLLSALALLSEPGRATVGEVCTLSPYIVEDSERVDNVAQTMAENDFDAAVVTRRGRLVGIFTSRDACMLLAQTYRDFFGPNPGSDAA